MELLHDLDVWFADTFKIAYSDDGDTWLTTMTPQLPFAAVALYLVMVFGLPKFLPHGVVIGSDGKPVVKNGKKVFQQPSNFMASILKIVLPLWNLMLSFFSVVVLIGVGLPYYRLVQKHGFLEIFCDSEGYTYQGTTGLLYWAYMFALSKYIELIDTLWLILKRRDVQFLHWYHHTTVLLFTWFAEYFRLAEGYIFIMVNAFVHTVMYFYYFLMCIPSVKAKIPEKVAFSITVIQIAQMFVGIGVNGYWIYLYLQGRQCACEAPLIIITSAIIMYGTYLYLFLEFFVKRYFGKSKAATKAPKKKSHAE